MYLDRDTRHIKFTTTIHVTFSPPLNLFPNPEENSCLLLPRYECCGSLGNDCFGYISRVNSQSLLIGNFIVALFTEIMKPADRRRLQREVILLRTEIIDTYIDTLFAIAIEKDDDTKIELQEKLSSYDHLVVIVESLSRQLELIVAEMTDAEAYNDLSNVCAFSMLHVDGNHAPESLRLCIVSLQENIDEYKSQLLLP